jgi:hypothetical protein
VDSLLVNDEERGVNEGVVKEEEGSIGERRDEGTANDAPSESFLNYYPYEH